MEVTPDVQKLALEEAQRNFWHYIPYPKQREFHNLHKRERAMLAGNQVGKTFMCAIETAFHTTGNYPKWWKGFRFERANHGWASGVTSETTRDVVQRKLFGDPLTLIGGSIHNSYIIDKAQARGVADLLDTVWIKHKSGGTSEIQLKSYEKGREKWQGPSLDWIWLDEEPPEDVYNEALARISATKGIIYSSFTPLLGMTNVAMRYWKESSLDRGFVLMGLKDASHFTQEEREKISAGYPVHERDARINGIPALGSGRVFPVTRDQISKPVPEIPHWWPRICGLDFGWDHPTAAVWIAWDRDNDRIWVYDAYRMSQTDVMTHAGIIRSRGDWIPVAWPHDGLQHDKGSGEQLAQQYLKHGVNMLSNRATFPDGSNGVEAGIAEMLDRMKVGKLYVAPHLEEWFEEFELYHRTNGKIEKLRDDLLSATRYAMMMLRYSIKEPSENNLDLGEDLSYKQNRNPITGY